MKPAAALILAVAVMFALPAAASAQLQRVVPRPAPVAPAQDTVPGQVIVQFKPGVSASARGSTRREADVGMVQSLRSPGQQLLEVQPGQTVASAIRELESDSRVKYAQPNFIYHATAVPNDRWFGQLWGMRNTGQAVHGVPGTSGAPGADIDATLAWDRTTGSKSILVAVIDTGVAYDHPDLDGNIAANRGFDFCSTPGGPGNPCVGQDNDPADQNEHGTHVAGTIGAEGNNGIGVAGVNWAVSIMAVRVLNAAGDGSSASVAAGFDYAGDQGARVANASLGGTLQAADFATLQAIEDHPTTLYVVAAGNGGPDGIGDNNDFQRQSPCNLDDPDLQPSGESPPGNLVCVAATTQTDARAGFSNFGARSVDLGAPGTNILSSIVSFQFGDDFEDGLGKWTAQAPWGIATNAAAAGVASATDSPGGNYAPAANTSLTLRTPVTLPSGCEITYAFRLQSELETMTQTGDPFFVETSTAPDVGFSDIDGFSGSTGVTFDSSSAPLPSGTRYIRFRMTGDGDANVGDGVYIDDVKIGCLDHSYDLTEFAFFNGTSMATPHVAGAAALALSLKPSATPAELKSALMSSGDPDPALAGITVSGRRLNVANLLNTISPLQTTPPTSPLPTVPPVVTPPAPKTLNSVKVDRCKQSGRGRTLQLKCRLRDSDALRSSTAKIKKGRRTLATGKVKLSKGSLSVKLKRKLRKGRYTLTLALRGTGGARRTLNVKFRI
jgi:subtilisin family serine protease